MITVQAMRPGQVPDALEMWRRQYERHCGEFYRAFWPGGEEAARSYLLGQIAQGKALAAHREGELVGYIAWMNIDFHAEASAFCPVIGHGAREEGKEEIYRLLYGAAAEIWVGERRYNHLMMMFYRDRILESLFYQMGFGLHVVDGCRKIAPLEMPACPYTISKAGARDVDALIPLLEDFWRHLRRSPLFLARDQGVLSREGLLSFLSGNHAFLARDGGRVVGVLSVMADLKYDIECLFGPNSARIGGIGAYTHPDYRGRGIANRLLAQAIDLCGGAGKEYLHVSFEGANADACRFWPRHFTPYIRSVRRAINKDINL